MRPYQQTQSRSHRVTVKTVISIIFAIILASVSYGSFASVKINQPLLILVDKDGVKVSTDSTSVAKAMEKASELPNGVYTLKRPDITITVNNIAQPETNNSVLLTWTAPTENTDGSELTDLEGFNVYYGTSENNLSIVINVDNPLTEELRFFDLIPNTYHFAVSAVNELGIESIRGDIVTKVLN